jgi:hypothetical protein
MTTATYREVDQFYADAEATKAAEQAVTAMMLKHGSELPYCGFAWISYPERIRKNSQTAKALAAIGFTWNDYYKRMQKRSPYGGQSMDFAEASCQAYVAKFEELTGLKLNVSSRAD